VQFQAVGAEQADARGAKIFARAVGEWQDADPADRGGIAGAADAGFEVAAHFLPVLAAIFTAINAVNAVVGEYQHHLVGIVGVHGDTVDKACGARQRGGQCGQCRCAGVGVVDAENFVAAGAQIYPVYRIGLRHADGRKVVLAVGIVELCEGIGEFGPARADAVPFVVQRDRSQGILAVKLVAGGQIQHVCVVRVQGQRIDKHVIILDAPDRVDALVGRHVALVVDVAFGYPALLDRKDVKRLVGCNGAIGTVAVYRLFPIGGGVAAVHKEVAVVLQTTDQGVVARFVFVDDGGVELGSVITVVQPVPGHGGRIAVLRAVQAAIGGRQQHIGIGGQKQQVVNIGVVIGIKFEIGQVGGRFVTADVGGVVGRGKAVGGAVNIGAADEHVVGAGLCPDHQVISALRGKSVKFGAGAGQVGRAVLPGAACARAVAAQVFVFPEARPVVVFDIVVVMPGTRSCTKEEHLVFVIWIDTDHETVINRREIGRCDVCPGCAVGAAPDAFL